MSQTRELGVVRDEPEQPSFSNEALASVVVFLIALPLCMGIAIASGRPAAAGILTGIIGGIIVGLLAGCPLQVSGPAAGLSVIVWELVNRLGPEGLAVVVVLAGLIQLAAGALKLGNWFRAVPPAVIHGMLAGIGVLLFASQFHVMVDDKPKGSGLQNLVSIPEAVVKGIVPLDGSPHHQAAMLGVITLISLLLWLRFAPKKLKRIPAQLVGVLTASTVAWALGSKVQYVTVPQSLAAAVSPLPMSAWQMVSSAGTWITALAVAVIASAETLLTAGAVDKLQTGERTKYDKELVAQGIGNLLCGMLGGLPMTGVIARSKANLDAGARTRWSTVMHGCWLLCAVAVFPQLLAMIPVASLAGLLVYTGFKLVDPNHMRDLWAHARVEFAIYLATLLTIVCGDLLKGVLLGIVLSAARLLWTLSHLGVDLEEQGPSVQHLRLQGVATFLLLPRLAVRLDSIPKGSTLIVDASQLDYIDHACIELMRTWAVCHEQTGGKALIDWNELEHIGSTPRRVQAAVVTRSA